MGEVFSAKCQCGYEQGALWIGAAPGGEPARLAWCPVCRRHRAVAEGKLSRGCPACRSLITVVTLTWRDEPDEGVDFDARYSCGICGQKELRFDLEGFFD